MIIRRSVVAAVALVAALTVSAVSGGGRFVLHGVSFRFELWFPGGYRDERIPLPIKRTGGWGKRQAASPLRSS